MKKIIAFIFLYALNVYGADKKDLGKPSGRLENISSDIRLEILQNAKHPITLYKTMRVLSKKNREACSNDSFINGMMMNMSSRKRKSPIFVALQIATPEMECYLVRKMNDAQVPDEEKRKYWAILCACKLTLEKGRCIGHERSKLDRKDLYIRQMVVASSVLGQNIYKEAILKYVINCDVKSLQSLIPLQVHTDQRYEQKFGKANKFLDELLDCCIRDLVKRLPNDEKGACRKRFCLCEMTNSLRKAGAQPTEHQAKLLRAMFEGEWYTDRLVIGSFRLNPLLAQTT